MSIEVTKATGRWGFEIVWFDEKAEDWDGMEATYSEVKAAGFVLPKELYQLRTEAGGGAYPTHTERELK